MKLKKQLAECESISTDTNKIKEYFDNLLLEDRPSLVSLINSQWITEMDVGKMSHLLNENYNDTLCLISTPDMYSDKAVMQRKKIK